MCCALQRSVIAADSSVWGFSLFWHGVLSHTNFRDCFRFKAHQLRQSTSFMIGYWKEYLNASYLGKYFARYGNGYQCSVGDRVKQKKKCIYSIGSFAKRDVFCITGPWAVNTPLTSNLLSCFLILNPLNF